MEDGVTYGNGWLDQNRRWAMGSLSSAQIVPSPPSIKVHSNSQMIHEMLERGYAVMKIPENGKLKGLE